MAGCQTNATAVAGFTTGEVSLNPTGYGPKRKQPVFPPPHLHAHLHKAPGAKTTQEAREAIMRWTGEREAPHFGLVMFSIASRQSKAVEGVLSGRGLNQL